MPRPWAALETFSLAVSVDEAFFLGRLSVEQFVQDTIRQAWP